MSNSKKTEKRTIVLTVQARKLSTNDLCKSLVAIAAFHIEDTHAQKKIYEAVRRLQILDRAGTK